MDGDCIDLPSKKIDKKKVPKKMQNEGLKKLPGNLGNVEEKNYGRYLKRLT